MSNVVNFPRRALRWQAFVAVILFGFALSLIWTGYRFAGAFLGANELPSRQQVCLVVGLAVGFMLWNSFRRPRDEIRSWIKLRVLWRHGRWVALFGFPVSVMLFGIGLGATCAIGHWFREPAYQAFQTTASYAAIGGLLGLFGGFGIHLPGADGYAGLRRAV